MAADSDFLIRPADGPPPYDFARPLAFAARHLRAAERAHALLATSLEKGLTERFGEPVVVRSSAVDEVRILDYDRSRTLPSALFRARLDGHAVGVDLAPALALYLVERHLGGRGPLEPNGRALSDLEQRVTANQGMPTVLRALTEAWGARDARLDGFSDRPDRLVLALPETPAVVGEFEVSVGPGSATIAVCYPADAFRALLASAEVARAVPDSPGAAVDGLPVDLHAEFGRTRLPVGDLLRLAPGDVIPLGRSPEAPVPVWIGGRRRFDAAPGLSGRRLALHLLAASDDAPPTDD